MRYIKFNYLYLSIFFLMLSLTACEKPAGPGGNSTIKGKVMVESYDQHMRVLQERYPAVDEDVFIIYGDRNIVGDDIETSDDGTFEFNYLAKGDYTLVVYSDADSVPDTKPVKKHISITSNNSEVDAGEIVIYDLLDFDDGSGRISGRVMQVNWTDDFVFVIDTSYAQNEDVFLVYEDDDFVTERIRTLDDGRFAFPNLIKGNYTIYALSEDVNGFIQEIPRIRTVTIEHTGQYVDLGTIYIDIED